MSNTKNPHLDQEQVLRDQLSALENSFAAYKADQEKLVENLRQGRGFFENLVESALDIIYRSDARGFFSYVNHSATVITGYPREELIGMHYSDFIREDYREKVRQFYINQMKNNEVDTYMEMPIVRKDGTEIWVAQKVHFVIENGLVKEAFAVSRDVTKQRLAEKELVEAKLLVESAQKTEKAFLLRMSHEMRTPMNAIGGMTHLLYDTPLTNQQREYLKSIQYSSDLLSSLVSNLLNLGTAKTSGIEVFEEEFRLKELVETACNMIRFKHTGKFLKVNYTLDQALPSRVFGGKTALNQTLWHLLGNSVKFSENGDIDVHVKLLEQTATTSVVQFEVIDQGIGIAKEFHESIFEDFRQGGEDIHSQYGGSGVGLSIARELLELMDGSIRVESELGKGAAFIFKLPLSVVFDQKAPSYSSDAPVQEATPWSDRKILLVEDNLFNQVYATELLNTWGLTYEVAEDGEKAIAACEAHQFDLVLMDVQMPVMDGYEATIALRDKSSNPNSNVPILALSAGALPEEKAKAKEVGMNDYLTKPFTPDQLLKKLERWFGSFPKSPELNNFSDDYKPDSRLDIHLLQELYGGDLAYMLEMFDIFEAQTPINLETLQELLSAQDLNQLSAFAHKVKPTFAMIGFPDPGMALETISELARTQDQAVLPTLEVLMEGLKDSIAEGLEIVRQERKRIAAVIEDQN